MRKWFLAAVLFALGLSVLFWLTRHESGRAQRSSEPPPELQNPGRFTPVQGTGEHGTGLHLSGAGSITKRADAGETRHVEYTLTFSDVDTLENDAYDMHDVVLRLFDPATDKERAQLLSPLTRLRLQEADGKTAIAGDQPVRFNNAELLLEQGGPIVPLTLKMPLLEWTPASGELRSSDRVHLEGRGLVAEGSGLEASLGQPDKPSEKTDTLRLLRDGSVDLVLESGAHANLRATRGGPFEIRRSDPLGAIEVHVTEGARLELQNLAGSAEFEIKSDELLLRGVQQQTGPGGFRLLQADAKGAVDASSRGDRFKADSAHWSFDAQGRLASATLEGAVELSSALGHFAAQSAEFHFAPDGRVLDAELKGEPNGEVAFGERLPAPARELVGARAHIRGAGPLQLDFRAGTQLKLGGPAHLEIPEQGFALDAEGLLSGDLDANQQTGTLLAEGGAHAVWHASELSAPRLDVPFALGTERGDVVGAIATGHTHASLAPESGEPIELDAEDGLEARSIAGKLTIPLARGVQLERKGPESFHARAQTVRDFDHLAQSFTAEGDVRFDNREGRGLAERVVATGPDAHDFFGSARTPARWEVVDPRAGQLLATAQAVEIHVRPALVEASGSVMSQVEGRDAHYRLECASLKLSGLSPPGQQLEAWQSFRVDAQGAVRARSESQLRNLALESETVVLLGQFAAVPGPGPAPELVTGTLEAHGGVSLDWFENGELHGEGESLRVDALGAGKLWAPEGARVRVRGRLPGREQPYQLDADWIEFDPKHIDALHAALALIELQGGKASAQDELLLELSTEKLHVDEHVLHLEGQAHAVGRTGSGQPWAIDADDILLQGDMKKGRSVEQDLGSAVAQGSVRVQLGENMELRGDRLQGAHGRLRVEGHPAVLEVEDAIWESAWIEYDPVNMLLATARGTIRARDQRDPQAWSVEYESLQPFDYEDTSILVLHNPIMRQQRKELHATWALFWVDREEWRSSSRGAMRRRLGEASLHAIGPEPETTDKRPARDLRKRFVQLRDDPLAQILSEVYVEGEVELIEKDANDPQKSQRRGRADALYLDLRQGLGWLQNADLVLEMPFRGHGIPQSVRAKASWMRVGTDFSLLADNAVITSCEYDEPHYMIETGHLRVALRPDLKVKSIEARKNSLRFGQGGLAIPLPTIDTPTDEHGNPLFITDLFAGSSSQFGASLRASVNLTLGSLGFGLGKLFGGILSVPTTDLQGHWKLDVGILGTRGLLLGVGLDISIPKLLRMQAEYSFIPDGNEDRGLVRVDENDRDLLRQWFHMRARRFYGPTEWLDLAFSWQSDPGMQAEFYERDYLSYEQKDIFLHWRKAENSTYWSASVKPQLEDRTEVLELPKAGWYLGRHPVFRLGELEVLYSAQANAGYLLRREGDPLYYQPFQDGLGERDVARVDTEHRLEMPFALGLASVRLTPFVAARGSAWSANADGYENTARGLVTAGMDASTTLWKRYQGGTLSTITPRVSVHGDVVDDQSGADPVPIDQVEQDPTGTYADFGLRTRWWHPRSKEHLDVDLSVTHAWNIDGQPDAWQPVAVLGEFLTFVAGVPVGVTHDARYAIDDPETVYSRSFLGFRPLSYWGIELGYHHARDDAGVRMYDAASVNTRYRATQKWELELSATVDLDQGDRLDRQFTLRRLGHDFVMEIGVGFRAGEGTNFGLRLTPNIGYRRSGLGLIDRWLGQEEE
jgi:hypothetical protein